SSRTTRSSSRFFAARFDFAISASSSGPLNFFFAISLLLSVLPSPETRHQRRLFQFHRLDLLIEERRAGAIFHQALLLTVISALATVLANDGRVAAVVGVVAEATGIIIAVDWPVAVIACDHAHGRSPSQPIGIWKPAAFLCPPPP